MKKLAERLLFVIVLSLILSGCGKSDANAKRYAMLTDPSGIVKGSLTEQVYSGVETAAMIKPCSSLVCTPGEESWDAYKNQLREASRAGAKVIVCAGDDMSVPVYEGQEKYKKLKYVLVEGTPTDRESWNKAHGISEEETYASEETESSGTESGAEEESSAETVLITPAGAVQAEPAVSQQELNKNTCVIRAAAQDPGYLLGYALVAEGYTRIGFMGGTEETDAAYASGFIQGADRASQDKALPAGTVSIRLTFTGDSGISPLKMDRAMRWYEEGTQVIFAPQKSVREAVIAAAELYDNVFVAASALQDASDESPKVLMTAVIDYKNVVSRTLQEYENGAFRGGETVTCGILDGCVSLSVDYMRLVSFTDNGYSLLMSNISNGIARISRNETLTGQYVSVSNELF